MPLQTCILSANDLRWSDDRLISVLMIQALEYQSGSCQVTPVFALGHYAEDAANEPWHSRGSERAGRLRGWSLQDHTWRHSTNWCVNLRTRRIHLGRTKYSIGMEGNKTWGREISKVCLIEIKQSLTLHCMVSVFIELTAIGSSCILMWWCGDQHKQQYKSGSDICDKKA